jgi:hypothetical protein
VVRGGSQVALVERASVTCYEAGPVTESLRKQRRDRQQLFLLLLREVAEGRADGSLELGPVGLELLAAGFSQADYRAAAVYGVRGP